MDLLNPHLKPQFQAVPSSKVIQLFFVKLVTICNMEYELLKSLSIKVEILAYILQVFTIFYTYQQLFIYLFI